MTGLVAPLCSRWTYRRWVHLLLGGVLLLPYVLLAWVFVLALGGGGVGEDPFGLAVLALVTLVVAVLIAVVPAVRVLEVAAARALLGVELPEQTIEAARAWPARRRSAVWLLANLVAGGLATLATLIVLPLTVGLAEAPFRTLPAVALGRGLRWEIRPGWESAWVPLVGLGLLIALVYLVAGLGALLARWAPALLGPTPDEELAALRRRATALAERNRLARELHDSVGHALTIATLQAGAARRVAGSDPPFVESALAAIEQTSRTALEDLDHVLGLLRDEPAARGPQRSLTDVQTLVADARASGVPVSTDVVGDLAGVPAAVSREAYRIVQEGLTNALRHAGPVPVTLRLAVLPDRLEVQLSNPLGSVGTGSGRIGGGRGLTGIRERVEVLRGEMSTMAQDGQFRVTVRLPLRAPR